MIGFDSAKKSFARCLKSSFSISVASFASAPEDGRDLLVITNQPLQEEYSAYIEPFGLKFSREPAPTATPESLFEASPTPFLIDGATPTPIADDAGGYNPYAGDGAYPSEGSAPIITYVTVPGLGKLDSEGLGIILFAAAEERNTLVLLTAKASDLSSLAALLSSGSLGGCTIQENMAVCPLSSISAGYNY